MTATDEVSVGASAAHEKPSTRSRSRIGGVERATFLLLFLGLAGIVFLNSRGVFTPDIKPEVYLNPLRRLAYDLAAWQADPQLGVGNYNNGLAPVSALTAALRGIGLDAILTARLLRLALYSLGAWGAVRLYRDLSGQEDTAVARVVAAVVFVLNPYAITAGATLAVLLPYALLPWQLLALARAMDARGGWRWPAVFALTVFAMSGMNVAAVPLLQLAVAVPAVLGWTHLVRGVPWRSALAGLLRSLLLAVLVSLYWVLPALNAFRWGSTVAAGSESLDGIASTSSFAEVLRGLGLWPLYGGNAISGPWQPGFVGYLSQPFVILASFALVAVAAAAALPRTRIRLLSVLLLSVAAVVMVGLHPPGHSSPAGTLMRWVFENVPGALALRTTNKAGGALALGIALLVAAGAAKAVAVTHGDGQRIALATGLVLVLVGASLPAFTGDLYVARWRIPQYWEQATTALDTGDQQSRVWFVPGQVLARYRWNTEGPDDVNLALLDRPSLLRTVLPVSSAHTTNLLAGVDSAMQAGQLPATGVSVLARYLGVGQVLLRNDVTWEDPRGGRPAVIAPRVAGDTGLRLVNSYGSPGQNTTSLLADGSDEDRLESALTPLQVYDVRTASTIVRTESEQGQVLVDGDGFAVPELVGVGLLSGDQSFRYLGDLDAATFERLLGPQRRIVVTDSNQRRAADEHYLTDAYGPLITADEAADSTRALYGPDEQTVARYSGIASVTATAFGSPFDVSTRGAPELALDGDLETGWSFGAFDTALQEHLTIQFRHDRRLDRVTVRSGTRPGPLRVTRVWVRAGDVTREADLDSAGNATVDLGGVRAREVQVGAARTEGEGINQVRIAELEIPGLEVTKAARVPTTLTRLAATLDEPARSRLAQTPIDVVLTRTQATDPEAIGERSLLRDFALPDARTVRPFGLAEMAGTSVRTDADGCVTVGTLDGQPLRVRPQEHSGTAVLFNGCTPLALLEGAHSLRAVDGWTLDTLVLRDVQGETVVTPDATPAVQVTHESETAMTVRIAAGNGPYLLVLGQSVDPGWRGTIDGRPLGEAVTLDGYSAAWSVADPGPHVVRLTFAPQRVVDWSRAASAIALLLCLVLLVLPDRRRLPVAATPPAAGPDPSAQAAPRSGQPRRALRGVLIVVLCWFAGGLPLVPAGVVGAAAHVLGRPRPRALVLASVALFGAVPFTWMLGNNDIWAQVTPALVTDNPLPGWLAASGLALLVVGVVDDRLSRRAGGGVDDR